MGKRILFLGAAHSQVPVIQYAKEIGLYVITVDYKPDNPGHKISDEYHNVSTVDNEKILELSQKLEIDAISAYASDPAAMTAAYVSEKMGLVGSSYQSVKGLSDKTFFRKFLADNNYPCPWFYSSDNLDELLFNYKSGKALIKPVDSSGSKGVYLVCNHEELVFWFEKSKSYSRTGKVILEEYIERKGPQLHGEGFVMNGELIFLLIGDQVFSPVNNLVPYSTTVPSVFHQDIMFQVHQIIKEIVQKVNFKTGGINVELIRDLNDKIYVLEIGARNGGNFMPQLMFHATGFDIAKANVDVLFGKNVQTDNIDYPVNNYYSQVILHSKTNARFDKINIPKELQNDLMEKIVYYGKGDFVHSYNNSKDVIGVLLFRLKNEVSLKKFNTILIENNWISTC